MDSSYRIVPLIIACALFMEMVDATALATALPSIAQDLGHSPLTLSLAITAYVLSLALFIPVSGWLADRIGAKRVFSAAILVFLAGSIASGLADSLWQLVAARALQGSGGALMTPVARLILLRSVPRERLVDAMAWMGVPALVGPIMGPPLGGFLVDVASWRWIFWINVPIGLIGLFAVWRFVPEIPRQAKRPFDLKGFLALGAGFLGLMSGLELADGQLAEPSFAVPLLVGGMGLLVLYVWYARRRRHPVVDLALLRHPTFRASVLGGLFFRFGTGGLPLLLPLLLQEHYGYSASHAGLVLCSAAVGAVAMKFFAGRLLSAYGFRQVLLINTAMTALLAALLGLADPTGVGLWFLVALLLLGGFSRSLQFTSINTIAYAEVEEARMGDATALASVVGQVAMAIGVAGAAALLGALSGPQGLPDAEGFSLAFGVIGLVMLAAVLPFWRLPPGAGSQITRRRKPQPSLDTTPKRELEGRV